MVDSVPTNSTITVVSAKQVTWEKIVEKVRLNSNIRQTMIKMNTIERGHRIDRYQRNLSYNGNGFLRQQRCFRGSKMLFAFSGKARSQQTHYLSFNLTFSKLFDPIRATVTVL